MTVTAEARQRVVDAAAVLHEQRTKHAAQISASGATGTLFRSDLDVMADSARWNSVLSVRTTATAAELRRSMPNNRARLAAGMQMVSIFDWQGCAPDARETIRRQTEPCYRFGFAPVQMKIIDEREALLQGPLIDGHQTVMSVLDPTALEAAFAYWHAVLATSHPATEPRGDCASSAWQLTERQDRIVDLMEIGLTDQAIADTLKVSLRTVRYEIAKIITQVGAHGRFDAGMKLARLR